MIHGLKHCEQMSRRSLNLLVDGDVFCWQRNGGISRLFQRVLAEMVAVDRSLDIEVVLSGEVKTPVPDAPRVSVRHLPRIVTNRRPWRLRQMAQRWMRPVQRLYWHSLTCDAFMSTYYTTPPVRAPHLVVAYDMIHEKYPDLFCHCNGDETVRQKKRALEHASSIISISKQTQLDLDMYLGIPGERCRVVYPASGLEGISPGEVQERSPFLLYVGDFVTGYKNFERLAKTVLFSSDSLLKDLCLFVCSAREPDETCLERYDHAVTAGRLVFHHVQSDRELAGLYSRCAAFVYPSLYEGFGIPILEALQFGAPVACSMAGSIPEAGGEAVFYFDPQSEDEMASAISKAVMSGRSHFEVVRRQQQAARFSWRKTEMGYLEAIRAVPGC